MSLLRALLLSTLLAASAPALSADQNPPPSPNHAVNQARLFIRKGWWDDARRELEAALPSPEAQNHFELRNMLSQVCFELKDIKCAQENSLAASTLAANPEKGKQAAEFAKYLGETFGYVEIQAPQPGQRSRMQIDMRYAQLDPELKRFINHQTLKLKELTTLPVTVSLPSGNYAINGQTVTVVASRTETLKLPASALGAKGLAKLQVPRLEVSAGFGTFFGERLSNIPLAPQVQVAFTQPVGRLLLGFTADESFRKYQVRSYSSHFDLNAWSAGLRFGTELLVNGPLAIRPSVGYRFGMLPGVAFDCTSANILSLDGVSCAAPTPDSSASGLGARYYVTAPIHIPYAELSIDYREAGRNTAMGMGIRVGVDQTMAFLPSETTAAWKGDDSGTETSIQIEDTFFTATGLRLMANLSIAF